MPRKNERQVVSVNEIPAEVIGAVVIADLMQIEADAKTHPDLDARRRILFAANRLRQIATNQMSTDTQAELFKKANIT
jgi:hypothetical protein